MALSGEIAPLSCQEADALTHPLRLSWEKSSDKPPKFIPEPDSKQGSSEKRGRETGPWEKGTQEDKHFPQHRAKQTESDDESWWNSQLPELKIWHMPSLCTHDQNGFVQAHSQKARLVPGVLDTLLWKQEVSILRTRTEGHTEGATQEWEKYSGLRSSPLCSAFCLKSLAWIALAATLNSKVPWVLASYFKCMLHIEKKHW